MDIRIEHVNIQKSVYEICSKKPRTTIIRGLTKQEAISIKTGEKDVIMRKTKNNNAA